MISYCGRLVVLPAALILGAHLAHALQQVPRFQQQIVEIERVCLEQLLAINLVNLCNLLGLGIGRAQVIILRVE
jgi:hypothetical protein